MGTGGSRYGAGRPASHLKAEHHRHLDVRRWQREGILRAGCMGAWQWTDPKTGRSLASISYRCDGGSVTLSYSIEGKPSSQMVYLSRSPCNFGGGRQWFVCPIRGERVAVLYLRAGRFACRHCQRLVYASQSSDACARTWRAQAKLEAKLGEGWARPQGMHWLTHERLLAEISACIERREIALGHLLVAMRRRYPMLQG